MKILCNFAVKMSLFFQTFLSIETDLQKSEKVKRVIGKCFLVCLNVICTENLFEWTKEKRRGINYWSSLQYQISGLSGFCRLTIGPYMEETSSTFTYTQWHSHPPMSQLISADPHMHTPYHDYLGLFLWRLLFGLVSTFWTGGKFSLNGTKDFRPPCIF
jgi:hypothetical protein